MRKLFITVNDGSIARNILRSFVLEKMRAHPDIQVGLITHLEKVSAYEQEFGSRSVRIFGCPSRHMTLLERILSYLIRNGLRTKTILMDQRTHREGRYTAFIIKRCITYLLGGSRIFHAFVRLLFLLRRPSPVMRELFLRERPDMLFSADVQAELDFDAIAAAQKFSVKIVGMVRSWDNLTARGGLVPYIPEKLLVWNPFLLRQAVKIQHIPKKVLQVVGIPHYDWYVNEAIIKSREGFLRQFGIDPSQKVILFAGEGKFHAPREVEVLEILSEKLEEGSIADSKNIALIFRPHPAFSVDSANIKRLDNVIFDEHISGYTGEDRSSWEMGRDGIVHLVNSLYHADLVVTIASTMIIDAAAFNKPVISVAFDGKSEEPYWDSVKRYYRDYTHIIELSKAGGFKIVYTPEELIRSVNEYLQNPGLDKEGREKIFKEFIWKLDGHSAERIVEAILTKL